MTPRRFTPPRSAFTGSWSFCTLLSGFLASRLWAGGGQVNRRRATHFERRNYSSCKLVEAATRSRRDTFPCGPTAWTTTAGSSHDAEVLPTA